MGVEHGILLMILGIITSVENIVMYVITVMSNERVDDKDSDNGDDSKNDLKNKDGKITTIDNTIICVVNGIYFVCLWSSICYISGQV